MNKSYVLTFTGLHCEACVTLITKRLQKIEGVTLAEGNPGGVFTLITSQPVSKTEILTSLSGTDYVLAEMKEN